MLQKKRFINRNGITRNTPIFSQNACGLLKKGIRGSKIIEGASWVKVYEREYMNQKVIEILNKV